MKIASAKTTLIIVLLTMGIVNSVLAQSTPTESSATAVGVDTFIKVASGNSPAKDGLPYVHSVLAQVCGPSNLISQQSLVKPKRIIIRESDGGRIEVE